MAAGLVRRLLIAALVLALGGCGGHLPRPPLAPHPEPVAKWAEVPYPPPPARVEVVPAQPKPGAVWIDGEWRWEGRRWIWHGGGWAAAPPGATFSPWSIVRQPDGALRWTSGAWHDANGKPIAEPTWILPAGRGGEEPAPAPGGDGPG